MTEKQKSRREKLREKVEKEIREHPQWCSPNCQTFLPEEYRKARLAFDYKAKAVQEDYDLCHAFR